MTTDIVVDLDTSVGRVPYFVKPVRELGNGRVQEKREIERLYWESLGYRLQVLTNLELSGTRIENIRWLRDWHWTDDVNGLDQAAWSRLSEVSMHVVAAMPGSTIGEACARIGQAEGITPGLAFSVLRHLGSRRKLIIDVDAPRPMLSDPIERFALPALSTMARSAA